MKKSILKKNPLTAKRIAKLFFNPFIIFAFFLTFSLLSGFASSTLKDYHYDKLAFSINNYNHNIYKDSAFKSTIVNVSSKDQSDKKTYHDLFNYFYYNQSNGPVREQLIQNASFDDFSFKLETQTSFSVSSSEFINPGYYIDYGLYAAYYMDEILGNRGYLNLRFNCEAFLFISDTLAEKLVDYYSIGSNEPFKELIQNEEYCVLTVALDNGETLKCCINNIVYSEQRSAWRTKDLYGDFALIHCNSSVLSKAQVEFEIDLKDSPFSIKKTLNDMESLGVDSSTYNIEFKSYDSSKQTYEISENITSLYLGIQSKSYSIVLSVFLIVLFSLAPCFCIYFFARRKKISQFEKKLSLILIFVCFSIYGLIATFAYNYILFSVSPIIQLIFVFCLFGKEIVPRDSIFNQRKSAEINSEENYRFYEIRI